MCGDEYPIGKECLENDRYVDEIPTRDEMEEGKEEQICQVVAVLDKIKFSLKHNTRSGEKPGDKASTDDESTKMLGYKWLSELDFLPQGSLSLI